MSSLSQHVGSRGALDVCPWLVMLTLLWRWVSGFSGPRAQCKSPHSCPGKRDAERGDVSKEAGMREKGAKLNVISVLCLQSDRHV